MFQKNVKKEIRNVGVLKAMLILVMALSACSFDAGESVVSDDVPSVKGQELSDGEEVVTITEVPEIQKDTKPLGGNSGLEDGEENQKGIEPSEGNSDLVDDEQNELGELGNTPTEETKAQEDSGASNDEPKPMQEGQEQAKGGQPGEEQEQLEEERLEEGQPEEQVQTWQSAYLEVVYHLWDYLAPRYEPLSYEDSRKKFDDPMDISIFYFGLHDFDGDGTLELVTGDGFGLAVFTYEDGRAKKIADLCNPDAAEISCINAVYFKDNSISACGSGSGGCEYINFGYLEGGYVLGHYNQITPDVPITINGREGTVEEMEKIYTLDFDKREEEEQRERFRFVNENGIWILKATWWSDEESVLDMNFDFDSVIW